MFHFILKFLLRPVFWVYYKKITLSGLQNVPPTGPAILACNHPNSFLDALLVGTYCPRKIHFLARSDVFRSPFAAWILGQMSIIPVYRLQEGVENLERNQDTFERCYEILRKGEVVLIFSEGLCIQEMRLRTLKKGTARIAMEFVKDGASLKIIPVGNNYPGATKAREHYMMGFGVPFDANEFTELYNENNAKGITAFNKKLTTALSEVVIDIRDKAHEKEYEQLVDMLITEHGPDLPKLVTTINTVQELPADQRSAMTAKLREYNTIVTSHKVRDSNVASATKPNGMFAIYTLLFGFFYVWHVLPVTLARRITKKTVKTREFQDSVLIGAAMLLNWLWFLVWTITWLIIYPILGGAVFAWYLVSGMVATLFYDAMTEQKRRTNFKRLPDAEMVQTLRKTVIGSL